MSKITAILSKHCKKETSKFGVIIRVYVNKKYTYFKTGIDISSIDFDSKKGLVKKSDKSSNEYDMVIRDIINNYAKRNFNFRFT